MSFFVARNDKGGGARKHLHRHRHRQHHFKHQHAAKVAIDALSRLIHSEPGTHHFRLKFIFFDSRIIFSFVVVVVSFCFDHIRLCYIFVSHNPHTRATHSEGGKWCVHVCNDDDGDVRRRMSLRSPKNDKKTENLWICYVFRILCSNFRWKIQLYALAYDI